MSTEVLRNKSNTTDAERFADFRAKRLAQKEAQKERLAAEFPLLFGKDAQARSTVGKYANKTTSTATPSKKKQPLGTSSATKSKTPREKQHSNGQTPRKASNLPLNKTMSATKNVNNGVKENQNKENKSTNNNANKPSVPKKVPSKGFFSFLSSKSNEEPSDLVPELRTKSKDLENEGIEIPTMNDLSQSVIMNQQDLMNVISEDSLQETQNNLMSKEMVPSLPIDALPTSDEITLKGSFDIMEEKIQVALDFMLDSKELDPVAHRRLSGQKFLKEDIRRISSSSKSRLASIKGSISAEIDFHAISRDISEEETMMLMQRAPAPLTILHPDSTYISDDEDNESIALLPSFDDQHQDRKPTIVLAVSSSDIVSNGEVAPEETLASVSKEETSATTCSSDIGDMDVLYALRNYIATLDEMTYYNNPMRNPSYLNKHRRLSVVSSEEPVLEVIATEPTAPETEQPETDIIPNPEITSHGSETDMAKYHDLATTPVSFLANGIAENKIVIFPRQSLYDELLKRGLVYSEINGRLHSENHVKYVIHIEVFPMPGLDTSMLNTRMMLLKRFSEFKEFREQLVACMEGVEDSEPIPLLPSRQSMSLSRDCNEEEYLDSRQRHLNIWLSSIFARQSFEPDQYRDTLYDFLMN